MSHEPQIRKLMLEWSTTCHEANVGYRVQSLVIEGRSTSESQLFVLLLVWKYIEFAHTSSGLCVYLRQSKSERIPT
jgi:hypothetical protein